MKRLLTVVVVGLVVLVAGCAGIPNSSSPQAIGTVDRPAPPNLPKPAPGMDPDVLLREFLKATADPANRHLAARQFLTSRRPAHGTTPAVPCCSIGWCSSKPAVRTGFR